MRSPTTARWSARSSRCMQGTTTVATARWTRLRSMPCGATRCAPTSAVTPRSRRPPTRVCSTCSQASRPGTICAAYSLAMPATLRLPVSTSPRRSRQRPATSTPASPPPALRRPRTSPIAAVALCEEGLARTPESVGLWRALGLAQLALRSGAEAAAAFERALALAPDDGETHYNHGVALQMQRSFTDAARAYQRALAFKPSLVDADYNLGVLFQQQGAARRGGSCLRDGARGRSDARVRVQEPGRGRCSRRGSSTPGSRISSASRRTVRMRCRSPCRRSRCASTSATFQKVDRYLDGLRQEAFRVENELQLADCLEVLLYLLLYFDVEQEMMLKFAQTYDVVAKRIYGEPLPRPAKRRPGRLRIGYLSADLRNHVMGKMIWQAIAHHDKSRFELFFYSLSKESDEWTERFRGIADRFEVVASRHERAAATRIAKDDLDILVDLSTHTKGAKPGILAFKPARVQITHVASAGVVGLSAVDFKLTDRWADLAREQRISARDAARRWKAASIPIGTSPRRTSIRSIGRRWESPRTRSSSAHSSAASSCRGAALRCGARCSSASRARSSRSLPSTPAPVRSTCGSPLPPESPPSACCSCRRAATTRRTRPATRSSTSFSTRCPSAAPTGRSRRSTWAFRSSRSWAAGTASETSYSILANLGVTETVAQSGREFVDIAVRLADDAALHGRRARGDPPASRRLDAHRHGRAHAAPRGGLCRGARGTLPRRGRDRRPRRWLTTRSRSRRPPWRRRPPTPHCSFDWRRRRRTPGNSPPRSPACARRSSCGPTMRKRTPIWVSCLPTPATTKARLRACGKQSR